MNIRRREIEDLAALGFVFDEPWQVVDHFEKTLAMFFGAPFAVAVDSCTHALELCLRYHAHKEPVHVPCHTYMSVPMMLDKIDIPYQLHHIKWCEKYDVVPGKIIDAATLWRRDSYKPGVMMCLSFQYKKHLAIGRGGMILLDDAEAWAKLQRMCRDGRDRELKQNDDNVKEIGYHYHMTPEDAARGCLLFDKLHDTAAEIWTWQNYRDLREMDYFKDK